MTRSPLGSLAAFAQVSPVRGSVAEPPAIDLVHLAKQTMGDGELEAELLDLFARQARQAVHAVSTGLDQGGEGALGAADRLHMLCGSARAVGSWEVADKAQRLEARLRQADGPKPIGRDGLAGLSGCVDRACRAIADLLAGRD